MAISDSESKAYRKDSQAVWFLFGSDQVSLSNLSVENVMVENQSRLRFS